MEVLVERFIRYCRIDTQSDESSATCPSSEKQLKLAGLLIKELKSMGLDEVNLDQNGYVTATLQSNTEKNLAVVGLIAHMDTSPDMSAVNVNPKIIKRYDGGDIILNQENKVVLSPADFPELNRFRGEALITTDGTTLLGADDKAGIAEIITALEWFIKNPGEEHGKVRVGFTPDEEIGRGADRFDVKAFSADFAYTVDGGEEGELEFENFNAALATITIKGRNVHPGTAKGQMINSMHIACDLNNRLPSKEKPEHTEGYEGFFHLIDIKGTVEETVLRYLIRDHDAKKFTARKALIANIVKEINQEQDQERIFLNIKDQYANMREKIEPHMNIIDLAAGAMRKAGVEPLTKPIRGGTDGARLSYMGLPCPNIFTGGFNFHGKYEFIPIKSMERAVETIKNIIKGVSEL